MMRWWSKDTKSQFFGINSGLRMYTKAAIVNKYWMVYLKFVKVLRVLTTHK